MLDIRSVTDLARRVGVPEAHLHSLPARAGRLVDRLDIRSPNNPTKVRTVYVPRPPLRVVQRQLHRLVLLPALKPSAYSHGAVPGRSILTNAQAHLGGRFAFTTDISDFYPSVRHERVYHLFDRLGCSHEVARLCARITTADKRLATGFCTSPILADRLMDGVDRQIAAACGQAGLTYTRYVDDITISGPFDLRRSGFPGLVRKILRCNGFRAKVEKERFGSLADGDIAVTKIRHVNGRFDVAADYAARLDLQLRDHLSLSRGGPFDGPLIDGGTLFGRVQFVCWVNPSRGRLLGRLLAKVQWPRLWHEATHRGLVAYAGEVPAARQPVSGQPTPRCVQIDQPAARTPPRHSPAG